MSGAAATTGDSPGCVVSGTAATTGSVSAASAESVHEDVSGRKTCGGLAAAADAPAGAACSGSHLRHHHSSAPPSSDSSATTSGTTFVHAGRPPGQTIDSAAPLADGLVSVVLPGVPPAGGTGAPSATEVSPTRRSA